MTLSDSDVIDLIAVVGAVLLTLAAGLLFGSTFGTIPGIGAAAATLGALLIAYAIPASRSDPEPSTEEPDR